MAKDVSKSTRKVTPKDTAKKVGTKVTDQKIVRGTEGLAGKVREVGLDKPQQNAEQCVPEIVCDCTCPPE